MKFKDFDKYQKWCKKTAVYPNIGKNFIYPTIGLMGEAGEVANKIKKIIRDDNSIITKEKRKELVYELGDMMWYIAQLSTELNLKLSDVTEKNLEKLSSRQKRNTVHGSGDHR
ncbi:MAG: nucleoside triphosphate pyrophosphohydrolase family protein [Candidatus Woesebacteria bacterium]|nr:nucleoside triphosphate pyrophosphohydrolase family protein [Candidatus Woesebacteria bacterium]